MSKPGDETSAQRQGAAGSPPERLPESTARRDRRVLVAEKLTEAEIELITKAEVPTEYAYLDAELGYDDVSH
jgi:hypothetical protein